jgi:hypothetical protein
MTPKKKYLVDKSTLKHVLQRDLAILGPLHPPLLAAIRQRRPLCGWLSLQPQGLVGAGGHAQATPHTAISVHLADIVDRQRTELATLQADLAGCT